jgi:hypothetical protein
MAEWTKKLSGEAFREIVSQIVWSYWPYWGAPILSAALLYVNGYPVGVAFLAAIVAFAAIAVGLNNFSQWMSAQTPADKIDFLGPAIGIVKDNALPPTLRGIKLGVMLRSKAGFPVQLRLEELDTRIGDRIPRRDFAVSTIMIGEGGNARFLNSMISLRGMQLAHQLRYGRIQARVSYGRPGKLKYVVEREWYLALRFDANGNFDSVEASNVEFAREEREEEPIQIEDQRRLA